jgi:excisionase family DNA binding protein
MAKQAAAQQPATDERLYTLAEAARLKGVSYHTASRAVRSGKLPSRRLGRMALVSATDLSAWRPMVERAPKKYKRRTPDPSASPAMVDLASGDRVALAQRFAILAESLHAGALDNPLPDFLGLLCERLAESLDMRRVAVWGIDRQRGVACRLANHGPLMSDLPDEIPMEQVDWFEGFLSGGSASVRDASEFGALPAPLRDVRAVFAAPLRIGDRWHGAVFGDRNGSGFELDADQLAFAQAVANQAAIALEIGWLREELAACQSATPTA